MKLSRGTSLLPTIKAPTVATIGNFDGVHLGHQEILNDVHTQAKRDGLQSALVCFEPTPKEYFLKEKAPARIYTLRDKISVINSFQIDHFICLRFNAALAEMPAHNFVRDVLVSALNIKKLIVGDDFRFGHKRAGDIQLLHKLAPELGFEVKDQTIIAYANARISSSLIREKLATGEFDQVQALLGRPFEVSGHVFHGEKKGRSIGFPTANILLHRQVSPIRGVFIVTTRCADNSWTGVANVGSKPTVNGKREQLEVHLFDCKQELYGKRIQVRFLAKLRDEQKFSSLDTLKHQISLDVEQAKQYFAERN